ncbi:hypothetical protein D3C76_1652290 [compost metagenome]
MRDTKGAVTLQVEAVRKGGIIRVEFAGAGKPFSLSLYGAGAIASVNGASASLEGDRVEIPAGNGSGVFTITLE